MSGLCRPYIDPIALLRMKLVLSGEYGDPSQPMCLPARSARFVAKQQMEMRLLRDPSKP